MSRARGRRRGRPLRVVIDPAKVRRAAQGALGAAVVAMLALVAVPFARRFALTHPYFAVREVVVRHRGQLSADQIRAIADIIPGMNVWSVDYDGAETRLLAHGWIRTAAVRRDLPSRVVVQVREYRPTAILAVADESPGLYYLASNGRIFAQVAPGDGRDLPYVTGLTRKDLAGDDAFGPRAVRLSLALLRHADRYRRALGAVSEVHVDRVAGLTLMPMRPVLPIEIGWGRYDAKLARVAEVLPFWRGRESELRSVSCIFDDEVIVRTRVARAPQKASKPSAKPAGAKTGTEAARAALGA